MRNFITFGAIVAAIAAISVNVSAESTETSAGSIADDSEYDTVYISADNGTEDKITAIVVATDEDAAVAEAEIDTETDSSEDKGSPDTGVTSVAGVAAVGIIAGGVAILTEKHNK